MRTVILLKTMIVAALMLIGCKNNVAKTVSNVHTMENENVMGYDSERVTQGSWLQLFIGMNRIEGDKDKDGYTNYYYDCRVPELEGDDGVLSQELEATWYKDGYDEPTRYRCILGLYVDKDFPSEAVFRQVELGIDTLLTQSFMYNEELEDLKKDLALRKGYAPHSSQDILNRAKRIFDQFTQKNSQFKVDSATFVLPEARVCIVAHKIYDQGDWASYIIEFSFDYNGSNGCPSWADYFTVNKKTGKRLTTADLVEKYGYARMCKGLRDAFVKGKQERNADLEVYNYTGQQLIDLADGCAVVNEGVMVYYRPYVVGCGAEGEFNLILDQRWP
jgi:hypothetical protein